MEGISLAVVAGSTPSFPSFPKARFALTLTKIKNQLTRSSFAITLAASGYGAATIYALNC